MKTLLLFLLAICFCQSLDPSKYQNSIQLDPLYTVYWKVEGPTMYLGLKVATTGWIGFGLAEPTSGSMPGADILVASVSEGKTTIRDMYTMVKDTPIDDKCMNWVLISGEESQGFTTVEVKRLLDTGDVQDRPFQDLNRVVIAWGMNDNFVNHQANRKATSIQFWGTKLDSTPNLPSWEFFNTGYNLPEDKTTYVEVLFNVTSQVDVSVVALEAVLTSHYVHHFLLFASNDQSLGADEINELLWGWAPGSNLFVLPSFLGYKFGPTGYRIVRIQIHYDNPSGEKQKLDSSGVRLYYQNTLRPIEAGVMELGDPTVANRNGIPRGSGTLEFEYDCPASCTKKFGQTLNVFANTLHMHKIGNQIWGAQWRDGVKIRETNRIDFWDFALQQTTPVNHTIEPGDRISTHCVYNQQSTNISFNLGSDDEMCIQFVYYYPRIDFRFCGFYVPDDAPMDTNFTLCGRQPIMGMNPTQLDPTGGREIKFASPNEAKMACRLPSNPPVDESGAKSIAITVTLVALFALLI